MTDYSRDRLGPDDEDRLPWLEPVEEEPDDSGLGGGKLVVWLVAMLAVIGLILGVFFWTRDGNKASSGGGALIEAPDSYYKERPAAEAPATRDDEIVYSASKGNEVESVIDTSSAAETPVNVARAPVEEPAAPPPAPVAAKPSAVKPAAVPAPAATVKTVPKPKPAAPAAVPDAAPASGGSTIQLGAFSSQAKANAAWKNLSTRFSFLAGLTQSVVPVQSGDKTLYRLRASGGNAGDICGRLRTAGESCSVIG